VVILAALPFACEEGDELPTDIDTGPISLDEIIASPKSPAPGDTISLTAVVSSDSQNEGDFPDIVWSASGGAFIENNQQTVRWVAPNESRMFGISCKATNGVNSSSLSIEVFVSSPGQILAARAGELYLWANETDLYYRRSTNVTQGAEIWKIVGGVDSDAVPDGSRNGLGFVLDDALGQATYMVLGSTAGRVDPPVEVFIDDLNAGTYTQVTFNRKLFFESRHDQFLFPKFSPDNNLVTFHQMFPAPFVGGVDTFDIDVFNVNTQTTTIVTETHGTLRRNNFHASFSSAQDWLVFLADRSGQNQWELYGLPVTGDQVATDSSATVRLSVTGGRMAGGTTPQDVYQSPPPSAWNGDPATNVLAWLDGDNILWLFALSAAGAQQTEVVGLGGAPRFMKWSNDGQQLAIATSTELYISDLAGTASVVLTGKPAGDTPRDVAWSADGNWLIYRVARSAFTWHELLDVGAGVLPQGVPAVITSTSSGIDLSTYSSRMSIASVMNSADVVTMLVWPGGQATPAISRVDVSGITQP
jgi:Tol biopolymer transport system component